jgi:phosphoribosylformylglycinamidine cyclo-ligase
LRKVLGHYRVKNVVHGIAHITGGGLLENTQRILPPKVDMVFRRGSWTVPPVFPWLQKLGGIPPMEMDQVFNMGIGLVLAVSPFYAPTVAELIDQAGYRCWTIGQVEAGSGQSRFDQPGNLA